MLLSYIYSDIVIQLHLLSNCYSVTFTQILLFSYIYSDIVTQLHLHRYCYLVTFTQILLLSYIVLQYEAQLSHTETITMPLILLKR